MSDMRLVVAGAGGRMGRTLIHAIAATDGVILAGAVEAASSAVIGRDAGELAGLGKNGVAVAREVKPLLAQADEALYCAKERGRNRVEVASLQLVLDRAEAAEQRHPMPAAARAAGAPSAA